MGVRYAVSTHLYHNRRLTPDDLQEIASHGFNLLELFATSSHFNYHDPRATEEMARWLGRAGRGRSPGSSSGGSPESWRRQ